MIRRLPLLAVSFLLLAPGAPAAAATGGSWTASSAEEFSAGSLEGTALDEEGRVHLALARETMWGPEQGVVWQVLPDGAGGAFAALSGPGRLLHVDADGTSAVWFEAGSETLVAAIALDGSGGVYAGLSPDGAIVRVTQPDRAEVVAETGALFIWALAAAPDGGLWIATGLPGSLEHRAADGTLRTVFDSGDDPVRCVLGLADGGALVGTGGRGRVIRFDERERPFVLLDTDEPEIVDIALGADGAIHVLAARASKQVRAARQAAAAQANETVRVVASPPPSDNGGGEREDEDDGDEPEQRRPSTPVRMPRAPGGAVLYRLTEGGGARPVWSSAKQMPFALTAAADGALLVATGDLGRIIRVDARGRASMLAEIPSDQVSAVAAAPDGRIWVGGTSDARVERIGPAPLRAGSYLTPAVDAGATADWGRLSWDAELPRGAALRVSVRSGNTDEPDSTWSDWVELRATDGEAVPSGLAPSRRLQARIQMESGRDGASPRLRHLEMFYLPRNRPPEIREMDVQPAGIVWSANPAQSSRPRGPLVADDPVSRKAVKTIEGRTVRGMRKSFELGARTVAWKAEDPDDDRLTFTLEIRREGASAWLPLASNVEDEYFGWDTRGLPDGLYRVRLRASDAPDNPGGKELRDARTSPAFRVDNTRPSIADPRIRAEAGGFDVEFTAADPGGAVAAVEVAVDDGAWEPLDPVDGVADSAEERYRTRVEPREPAPAATRAIRVRVTDGSGNLGGDAWPLGEAADEID